MSPAQEAAAVATAIDQGASPSDQSEAFAAALEKLQMMGAGNETDPEMGAGMDPSSIIEKLGACVTEETMDIDMQCIQGVLSTLDPAIIGKLAQCAGGGSIAEMQACVEEQLSGGDMTEPPAMDNETMPEDGNTTMPPEDTTSPSAFTSSSDFVGFSIIALVAGLFL